MSPSFERMECGASRALKQEAFYCDLPNKLAVKNLALQPSLDALAGLDDPHSGVFLAGRVSVIVGEKLGKWCPQQIHQRFDLTEGSEEPVDPLHGMHEELTMFTESLLKRLGSSSSTKLKVFNLDSSGSGGGPALSRLLACLLGMSNGRVLHELDSKLQEAKVGGALKIASGLSDIQVHVRTGELTNSDIQAVEKLDDRLTCRSGCPEMTVEPFGQRLGNGLGLEHIWVSVHDVLQNTKENAFVLLYVPTHAQLRTLLRSPDLRMAVATQLHLAHLDNDKDHMMATQTREALEQLASLDAGGSMISRFKAEGAEYRRQGVKSIKDEADALEGDLACLQVRLQEQETALAGLRGEYERRVEKQREDRLGRRVEIVQAEVHAWEKKVVNKRKRLESMSNMVTNRTAEKHYLAGVLADCQAREAERGADLAALIAKRDQLCRERLRVDQQVESAKADIVNNFQLPAGTKNRPRY